MPLDSYKESLLVSAVLKYGVKIPALANNYESKIEQMVSGYSKFAPKKADMYKIGVALGKIKYRAKINTARARELLIKWIKDYALAEWGETLTDADAERIINKAKEEALKHGLSFPV